MSNDRPQVRLATGSDMPLVCDILADAFHDDPVMRWMVDAPDVFATLFRYEAEALYKKHRHIYLTDDGDGAAMWLPGGVAAKPSTHWRFVDALWRLLRRGGVQSIKRTNSWDAVFAGLHPQEPHFYLHSLGARRHAQGRGVGSALLTAGLRDCDAQGLPAYLESSNELNNVLYKRFGFDVIERVNMPDGGPPVWTMWRPARSNAMSNKD